MEKPTIAAIDGYAIGIGFQLALSCDLRIATSRAQLLMWELKYGIACTIGGSAILNLASSTFYGPDRAWFSGGGMAVMMLFMSASQFWNTW